MAPQGLAAKALATQGAPLKDKAPPVPEAPAPKDAPRGSPPPKDKENDTRNLSPAARAWSPPAPAPPPVEKPRELDAAALAALRHLPDREAAQVVAELQRKGDAIRNPSAWVTKTCQGVQIIIRASATAYYSAPTRPPESQGT